LCAQPLAVLAPPLSPPEPAGDQDLICNWLGNRRWVDALDWSGKEGWSQVRACASGPTPRLPHSDTARVAAARGGSLSAPRAVLSIARRLQLAADPLRTRCAAPLAPRSACPGRGAAVDGARQAGRHGHGLRHAQLRAGLPGGESWVPLPFGPAWLSKGLRRHGCLGVSMLPGCPEAFLMGSPGRPRGVLRV
jgi:hypothetical protein